MTGSVQPRSARVAVWRNVGRLPSRRCTQAAAVLMQTVEVRGIVSTATTVLITWAARNHDSLLARTDPRSASGLRVSRSTRDRPVLSTSSSTEGYILKCLRAIAGSTADQQLTIQANRVRAA